MSKKSIKLNEISSTTPKKMHRKPNSIVLPQDTREMSAGGLMILFCFSFSRKGNKGICFSGQDKKRFCPTVDKTVELYQVYPLAKNFWCIL
jgi:hypothetical protein